MSLFSRLFGDDGSRFVKEAEPIVAKVNALEPALSALDDAAFPGKTNGLRDRLLAGETEDDILPEAFALVREAAKRTLGERHYDVQLMGGLALHKRNIAEMRTGEGKTLVATLPTYLNAISGKGVHVVTVNDYLSRRDAVWMGQIYAFLGLSVGVLNHDAAYRYDPGHIDEDKGRDELGSFKVFHEFLRPVSKKEAYAADITYGTNNEFGFDYLRDNIAYKLDDVVQRGYHYAVVDEIDSILIDEARTPLIISAQTGNSEDLYAKFVTIAAALERDRDFTVDEKRRAIALTDEGIERAEKALGVGNIYSERGVKYVHHLETAVRAKALFQRDKEYVVKGGEVIIVDEFTGRLQPGRRWSEGLHQAVEAKEGVRVKEESRTFASITFQNYFRMYEKLAGMTGTAATSAEEFRKVYGLTVVPVPTHRPSARTDHNDLIFQTEKGKLLALTRRVKALHGKGQPVLIGTVSIEKNEVLSAYFAREGIPHTVLNAKNHEQEGEIIAQAGKKGAVTIATNMAGRGVDIKLGGVPFDKGSYDAVRSLGGLYVLGTERHEARRIDNQLRGRAGRQGDPGETQFYVSLEDTLMRVFASDTVKNMMGRFGIPEDEPIEAKLISRALESAQEKIEGFNFDARKHVLEYDDVLNQQRKSVYDRRRKILEGDRSQMEELLSECAAGDEAVLKDIEGKRTLLGEATFYDFVRRAALSVIDLLWVDHLELMEYTRSSVNLRAYGQRDPLVEYKREGLRLFREMQEALRNQLLSLIASLGEGAEGLKAAPPERHDLKEVKENALLLGNSASPESSGKAVSSEPKVGRNDPCPCGSGKKYKKCGEQDTEEHKALMAKK
ncbi:preprotein translocase subunit SecA [Candidatus Parcubacteria bacterium]|nr:preprotein translocase subunit SecA [Candidatus Parcubacteria bacterium]